MNYSDDQELKPFKLPSFAGGYNSYVGGKSTVDNKEFPYGQNVVLTGNGSLTKVPGSNRFSPQLSAGHSIYGMGWLSNTTYNKAIGVSNTSWYDIETGNALTGVTFTADKKTHFCQAIDRLYGANNTDNLAYTTDGATITAVSSNGNVGDWPVYYNQRLYMTNAANPDRIYYSNPINATSSSYAVGDFGTFNTDLSSTPKKNAGFIILIPGGGVRITRLYLDNTSGTDYLYVYTKRHGIWRVTYAAVNTDGSIAHTITQVITSSGTPAGDSVVKNANDQWFYDGENFTTYGEQAQFQNLRLGNKSARIKTETESISSKPDVCGITYKSKIYYAYQTGSYNDTLEIFDIPLNGWSSPIKGKNVSCFMVYEDSNGVERLLAGSSSESYVYELETGSNDVSTAVNGFFECKSTDCGKPNLVKYFGFIDVGYALVYGTLNYEVFIDEVSSITGQVSLGNSQDKPAGLGSQPFGAFPVGAEYDPNTTFAYQAQNSFFPIDCNYAEGTKISVRFTNNQTGENFIIDNLTIWYLEGSIYTNR